MPDGPAVTRGEAGTTVDKPGEGPLAGVAHGVIDLHAHPMLKVYLFNRKFWKRHRAPKFWFPPCMRTDLDALIDGGVKCLLMATYVIERGFREVFPPLRGLEYVYPRLRHMLSSEPDTMTFALLDLFRDHVAETKKRRGDVLDIAYSYAEMQEIMAAGKLCLVNAVEGGHSLNGKIEHVDALFERGVAYLTIAHLYPNEAAFCVNGFPPLPPLRAIGCLRKEFDESLGFTEFGLQVAVRMFELGMIVDLSHATPPGRRQIYDLQRASSVKRPLVMTHVGVYEYAPYSMNPTPEDIRAIADTGGAIGFIFMDHWIDKPAAKYGEAVMLKTIGHLIQHGGEEVVAFGSDFDGFTGPPKDFTSPRDYNRVREILLRNYSDTQVEKFLSGNADRVLRLGWGKQ